MVVMSVWLCLFVGKLKSVGRAASVKAKSRQVLQHSGVLSDFEMYIDAVSNVEVKFPDVLQKARCISLLIPTSACTATIIYYPHYCKAYHSSGVFEYPNGYTLPAKAKPEPSVQLESPRDVWQMLSRVFDLERTGNHRL